MNQQRANLNQLGWDPHFEALFEPHGAAGLVPGRILDGSRDLFLVAGPSGEIRARVSGRFRHASADRSGFPIVGDWAAVRTGSAGRGAIDAILPRRSVFARKVAGEATEAQAAAANVDTVFLVTGLDGNFNLSRIERYLTAAWDSGASPVVVLNKSDLRADLDAVVAEVERIALGVPVAAVSAREGANLASLEAWLAPGKTVALLGPSGVGKSTIINRLLGEDRLRTGAVREDDSRGRHTTTRRELIVLPGGALLIDTPGMRELQLWAEEESLGRSFDDILALAARCRFADCGHGTEPGCAVRAAIESGALDPRRFASYLKQKKELDYLAIRKDEKAVRRSEKEFGRKMASLMKDVKTRKLRYR